MSSTHDASSVYDSMYDDSDVSIVSSPAASLRRGRAGAELEGALPPARAGHVDSCSELGASALDSSSDDGTGGLSRCASRPCESWDCGHLLARGSTSQDSVMTRDCTTAVNMNEYLAQHDDRSVATSADGALNKATCASTWVTGRCGLAPEACGAVL